MLTLGSDSCQVNVLSGFLHLHSRAGINESDIYDIKIPDIESDVVNTIKSFEIVGDGSRDHGSIKVDSPVNMIMSGVDTLSVSVSSLINTRSVKLESAL